MRRIAARGEMYHALEFEDTHADKKREFVVFEISEKLGDHLRGLSTNERHRLQSDILNRLESKEAPD